MFPSKQQVTEKIKREIKKFLEANDNENTTTQNLWDAAKAVPREVYSNTILLHETRKTSNRQPNFTPKTTGKRTKNPEITAKKKIIKIQAERNEKEIKETMVKLIKLKPVPLRR